MDIKMLIEKLTSQAKLDRQYNGDGKLYDDAADAIAALQAETEEVKRDRDLAINLAETNARLYDGAQEKLKQALDDLNGLCWCCIHGHKWEKAPDWSSLTFCEHLSGSIAAAGNAKLKCKHWQWRGRKEGKMKRLTDRRFAQDGFFFSTDLEERKEVQFMAKPTYKQLYDRLAAYEDTGLEPEDLKKAFNEDAVLKLAGQALGVEPDRLREMAQADRVGRCVVLPCKFGDTTFVVENNAISNGRVRKKYCPNCGARMDKED